MFPFKLLLIITVTLSPGYGGHNKAAAAASTSASLPTARASGQMADVIAIKEGADLDLSCPIVVQNEDMIISWTCDNEPANIKSSRIHVTDSGKLRIRSAKVGDSCNYRCEAADGYGTLSVFIKVIIVDRRLMEKLARVRNQTATAITTTVTTAGASATGGLQLSRHLSGLSEPQRIPASYSPAKLADGEPTRGVGRSAEDQDRPLGAGTELHNQSQAELEVQIEPSDVRVSKNRTFSLECRVKHAPHLMAPQIIWLKEFIGAKPSSLTEALELNLIVLDNTYYHSLNWPRSITYSHQSASSNSALLVRHSSYVHSGRYACFAGYPTSIMPPNLGAAATVDAKMESGGNGDSEIPSSTNGLISSSVTSLKPLKYKIAQATVQVDDQEGEMNHRLALESATANGQRFDQPHRPTNIFVSVISSNSWIRNMTIVLVLVCGLLLVTKYIHVHHNDAMEGLTRLGSRPAGGCSDGNDGDPDGVAADGGNNNGLTKTKSTRVPQPVCVTRTPLASSSQGQYSSFPVDIDNAVINNETDINRTDHNPQQQQQPHQQQHDHMLTTQMLKIDEGSLNDRLIRIIWSGHQDASYNDNDHVYSEISEPNNHPQADSDNTDEPYYKTPVRNGKMITNLENKDQL